MFTLDAAGDGIRQIAESLGSYAPESVAAVHVVSHGEVGTVQLGNISLNSANLDAYRDELTGWGQALTTDGDLLFYGCRVAEGTIGQSFVTQLSQLTGADVAASDDLTGNAAFGGIGIWRWRRNRSNWGNCGERGRLSRELW